MSAEALAVVKASWDAWERRDMPAVFDLYDLEIVWDAARTGVPGLGVFRGRGGVREFFHVWALDAFDDYYAVPEEFIDAGDHVVVGVRQGGTGKGSGAHVEMPRYWQSYVVRAGLITRVVFHGDRDEAVGSRPEAPD